MNPDGAVPHLLTKPKFPLNRVIALLGPYIALLSGALAAWLSQHFPGLIDNMDETTEGITQGVTFVIGAALTWALQHKYLDGWQNWEQGVLAVEAATRSAAGLKHAPSQPDLTGVSGLAGNGANGDGDPFSAFDPALFDAPVGASLGSGRASDG